MRLLVVVFTQSAFRKFLRFIQGAGQIKIKYLRPVFPFRMRYKIILRWFSLLINSSNTPCSPTTVPIPVRPACKRYPSYWGPEASAIACIKSMDQFWISASGVTSSNELRTADAVFFCGENSVFAGSKYCERIYSSTCCPTCAATATAS